LSEKRLSIDTLSNAFKSDAYERVIVIDRDNLSMRYRHDYIDRTPLSCRLFNGKRDDFHNLLERLYKDEIKKHTQDNKI
jgi:hypothetical protein